MIVDLDRAVRRLESNGQWSDPAPLSTYRYAPAYVLLGDPGAGKSIAFKRECRETHHAELVTARNFRAIYDTRRARSVETLFIDGLDEARAGGGDPRGPFDDIRARVREFAPRRVRLSCRELDWLGENDRSNLSKVAPGGELFVLRLEPLSRDEQRRIVEVRSGILDVEAFLAEAAERGVGGLLANPQTLVLLVQAVGENGEFPKGRTETFDRACLILAREPDDDHRIAAPLPHPGTLLDAAGRMCAVSLLSGSAGFALPDVSEADGFVHISVLGNKSDTAIRAAGTRLFAGVGNRRFAPVHANLAAFLGARYLAELVNGPVPRGRILSLLAGYDGAPPTPLRSLVAWLAALSPALRRSLIRRDPVAVLMYGDVRRFPPDHKSLLLDEVGAERTRLSGSFWPRSALEALATPDMEEPLRTLLRDPDRSDRRQTTLAVATEALRGAHPMPVLAADLLAVVRDPRWWPDTRVAALDAWIHSLAGNPARDERLREALGWIRDGSIKDDGSQILGTLLRKLYPRVLGPEEVWNYFGIPSQPLVGRFYKFWYELPDACPEDHLPAHLDYLAESGNASHNGLDLPRPSLLPVRFLARGIETHGEQVETARLTAWLRMELNEWRMFRPEDLDDHESTDQIRDWLAAHPKVQKAIIRFALRTDEFRAMESVQYQLNGLLYRSELPKEIGAWHLDEAVVAEDADLTTKHLMEFTRLLGRRPVAVDATLADARHRLRARPEALQILDSLLRSRLSEQHLSHRKHWQQVRARTIRPDVSLIRAVRSEEEELEHNCASPGLVHFLAQKYYEGRQVRESTGGHEHLVQALGGDERLADTALRAIRRTIERDDLPSAEKLVRLRRRNRMSWLEWPVLIGLGDRPVDEVLTLGDARLRAALACRLLQLGLAQQAAWYKRCVRARPDLVAEVLVLVGRALLASGETSVPDLQQLARDKDHAEVARQATLPLLRSFPARASDSQLVLLDALLWSGLVHLVTDGENSASFLRALVEGKARQRSTTRIARVRWLAAGLILDPERFQSELAEELRGSEKRIRSLARFCQPFGYEQPVRLTSATLEFLIRTLGSHGDPPIADLTVRTLDGIAVLLPRLIARLSQDQTRSATEALARLVADGRLSKWRPSIEAALDAQRVVRRDATFASPAPDKVIGALRDGPPANATDLQELVVDRLRRIGEEMRTTNANLWRQFWTEDKQRNRPKDEDACRDALLPLLQHRLPDGCDAQPEGQYAASRRADIWIASGAWNVPVEIKKNAHRDMWRAVRNQLLPRYANDPATDGLGIYLVLWFGPQHTAPAAKGPRPQAPEEMRDRLLDSLTPQERRRAAVLVMDVTPPRPAKR